MFSIIYSAIGFCGYAPVRRSLPAQAWRAWIVNGRVKVKTVQKKETATEGTKAKNGYIFHFQLITSPYGAENLRSTIGFEDSIIHEGYFGFLDIVYNPHVKYIANT